MKLLCPPKAMLNTIEILSYAKAQAYNNHKWGRAHSENLDAYTHIHMCTHVLKMKNKKHLEEDFNVCNKWRIYTLHIKSSGGAGRIV